MPKGIHAFAAMNDADAKNKTHLLEMGLDVTNVQKTKAGTIVSIGIGGDHVAAIANRTKIAVLLLVDADEYFRLEKLP